MTQKLYIGLKLSKREEEDKMNKSGPALGKIAMGILVGFMAVLFQWFLVGMALFMIIDALGTIMEELNGQKRVSRKTGQSTNHS